MNRFAEFSARPNDMPPLTSAEGLEVRAADEADVDHLAALAQAREGGALDRQQAVFRHFLRNQKSGTSLVLIATLAGRLVGYGAVGYFNPPEPSEDESAPEGWYLLGLVVEAESRRRGIGFQLTEARLRWIAERAPGAYYFANSENLATIELHRRFGFREVRRHFRFPGVIFEGSAGILFHAQLHTTSAGPE